MTSPPNNNVSFIRLCISELSLFEMSNKRYLIFQLFSSASLQILTPSATKTLNSFLYFR